jgi:CRISPR-associated protein Csx17
VDWLDAAIAISSEETRAFAPILGTGGNEGRLDYTNNFMERLSELLIAPDKKTPVRDLLGNALFAMFSAGLQTIAVGQYDPGRAGGFNQGEKIEVDAVANPWNAVLTLEGAAAWAGGIYRKQGVSYRSFLCSPFTVRPSAVGYGSASSNDEENARAEIWTPLWRKPARFREIQSLLREGRGAIDGKPARTGLDFAQAAGMLGVDRGIDAFVRFSLLKRRGDSYIALRAGQFAAKYRTAADLVRELTPLVEAAVRAAKGAGGDVPSSWLPLERAANEAIFQALLHDREDLLVDVAAAFGAMHRWLLLRNREVRWPGWLTDNWVRQVWFKDEVRIAASLAAMWSEDARSLRDNVTPGELRFSWTGRDLPARMLATLRRRTLDGASADWSPFASRLRATKADVIAFLERGLNEELIENLTFAFLLAKSPERASLKGVGHEEDSRPWLRAPSYCVLKQFFSEGTHPSANVPENEPRFRPDLAITSLLAAGRVETAMETAIRRLRIAGLNPLVRKGWDSDDSVRLGAALLIPVQGVLDLRKAVTEKPAVEE